MYVAKKTQATTNSIFISSHGLSTRDWKCNHYTIGVSVLPSQQPSVYLDYKKRIVTQILRRIFIKIMIWKIP